MGNNTWVLTDLPPYGKPLGCKWIFKRKMKEMELLKSSRLHWSVKALDKIYNLIIHQMDVKITFLNNELDEEVYMNQHQGFVMPVVLSSGYLLNQCDKCSYSKFDESVKGVIICLYVYDMLIFGTDQDQVDLTKEFLSSRFSKKYMGEADVILGIKIKHESTSEPCFRNMKVMKT
ncbi:zinc finger, CCHC-type containing protein [Tanacetum coccineum]